MRPVPESARSILDGNIPAVSTPVGVDPSPHFLLTTYKPAIDCHLAEHAVGIHRHLVLTVAADIHVDRAGGRRRRDRMRMRDVRGSFGGVGEGGAAPLSV